MERSHGKEGIEGKCTKDKGHDLWYRPGPLAEFRRIPMRCLSYKSRQQQHLLQWLQNWVHKKCSGLQRLTPNPDYRCARCMGNARPIEGRPQSEVQVGPDKLEVVASFCNLGDMLSAGGGCEMAVTTRVKTAWKKFRELLPVLTSRYRSYKTHGHVYSSCVRSAMLHASETWPLTKTNLQRLQHNDRAMIRQICSIKPEDVARVRSSKLLAKLQLEYLNLILREKASLVWACGVFEWCNQNSI